MSVTYLPIKRTPFPEFLIFMQSISRFGYIAGGCARWCLSTRLGYVPHHTDIDIFCYSKEGFEAIASMLNHAKGEVTHTTKNALTYKVNFTTFPIQLISPEPRDGQVRGGIPIDVINDFDLNVCQFAVIDNTTGICKDTVHLEEERDLLCILKVTHPFTTLKRIFKYTKMGYSVSNFVAFMPLFKAWDATDFNKKSAMVAAFDKGQHLSNENMDAFYGEEAGPVNIDLVPFDNYGYAKGQDLGMTKYYDIPYIDNLTAYGSITGTLSKDYWKILYDNNPF